MAGEGVSLRDKPGFFDDVNLQPQCPLYRLPAEIRDRIFTLALTAYEDKNALYDIKTVWSRPFYTAPRRSELSLLRTCKAIYYETWFKPWTLADHSFWLTSDDRAPQNTVTYELFEQSLALVHKHQGDVTIDHVRFFAQMYKLEDAHSSWMSFLVMPHFQPTVITLTLRHTDWWNWESDNVLHISSKIVRNHILPASTRKFQLELETLERKKEQLDSIVKQIKEAWSFDLANGDALSASCTSNEVQWWRGSSTLIGQRWCRDEVAPETLQYYVVTITFQRESDFVKPDNLSDTVYPAIRPERVTGLVLHSQALIEAQIPDGLTGEAAVERIRERREANAVEHGNRRSRRCRMGRRSRNWGINYL